MGSKLSFIPVRKNKLKTSLFLSFLLISIFLNQALRAEKGPANSNDAEDINLFQESKMVLLVQNRFIENLISKSERNFKIDLSDDSIEVVKSYIGENSSLEIEKWERSNQPDDGDRLLFLKKDVTSGVYRCVEKRNFSSEEWEEILDYRMDWTEKIPIAKRIPEDLINFKVLYEASGVRSLSDEEFELKRQFIVDYVERYHRFDPKNFDEVGIAYDSEGANKFVVTLERVGNYSKGYDDADSDVFELETKGNWFYVKYHPGNLTGQKAFNKKYKLKEIK